jgi:hypothetical protein
VSATPRLSRTTLAQGVIALALCIGGYMAVVDPPRQQIVRVRGQSETIAAQLKEAEAMRSDVSRLAAGREKTRAEAAQISRAGRLARDERELYSALVALAESSGMTVDQLAPAKLPARPMTLPGQAEAADARDAVVAYTITATGSYRAIAQFLGGLRGGLGYTLVRSVRLTATADESANMVRAVIETEHYSFDTAPKAAPATTAAAGGGS